MKLLKCIAIKLLYLINLSLETGIVQTILKISGIIHFLKSVIQHYLLITAQFHLQVHSQKL